MAHTYVALLRGINVGGRNVVPMAHLKAAFSSLGYREVATYIQSGNVVFRSDDKVLQPHLQGEIAHHLGFDVTVALREAVVLRRAIADNPFGDLDTTKLHIGFMTRRSGRVEIARDQSEAFLPERFAVHGTEVYFFLPNGVARTKLPSFIDRTLGVPITMRNWNTVQKLADLAREKRV